MAKLSQLVDVPGGFKPSVKLPDDFNSPDINAQFVQGYYPTQETLTIFYDIAISLRAGSGARARLFTGTFGTGKSDLMLMIANYMTRDADDELMANFFQRLRALDDPTGQKVETIMHLRRKKPGFLLVLLQADHVPTFNSFVMHGLSESLKAVNLEHLLTTTIYQAAIETIGEWQKNPAYSYQLGRLEKLLKERGEGVDQFRRELAGPQGDTAFEQFRYWHKQITSADFNEYSTIQRPDDAFELVAQSLPTDQYSGIFVIVDEFTQLLHQLGQGQNNEQVKGIDNLAETASRHETGTHLHFYVVGLEAFSAAQGATRQERAALEKSAGRFGKHHALTSANMEELVSSAIVKHRNPDSFLPTAQQDELLELASQLWQGKKQSWLKQMIVPGAFPLHPLALYLLPRLNSTLAQNERTMFRFLTDDDMGLRHFIHTTDDKPDSNGWYSLLTVDRLYHYFASALEQKDATLTALYTRVSGLLDEGQLAGLEGQLVRVALLFEATHEPPATLARLRESVNLPAAREGDVRDAIRVLEEAEIGYLNNTQQFRLNMPGKTSPQELRRRIDTYRQEHDIDWLSALNANQPLVVKADAYNFRHATDRQLARRFVTLPQLKSPATQGHWYNDSEGVVAYVVATTENERQSALQYALNQSGQQSRLVTAIPKAATDLHVKEQIVAAATAVQREVDSTNSDEGQFLARELRENKAQRDTVRTHFLAYHQLDWFYNGSLQVVNNEEDLKRVASAVMEVVYPDTPRHKESQHVKKGSITPGVKLALNELVQTSFTVEPPSSKKSPPLNQVLEQAAERLGLVKRNGKAPNGFIRYEVTTPPQDNSANWTIWNTLVSFLQTGVGWTTIVKTFREPPYGLYENLLALYLATFHGLHRDDITITQQKGKVREKVNPVMGETIKEMVQKPESYRITYNPLPVGQQRYLKALYRVMSYNTEPRGNLREAIPTAFDEWRNHKLTAFTRFLSPEQWQTFFPTRSPAELEISHALVQVTQLVHPEQRLDTLLQTLPTKVGLPAEHEAWDEANLRPAMEQIAAAKQLAEEGKAALQDYLTDRIQRLFGGEQYSTLGEVWQTVTNWRKERAIVERVPNRDKATRLLGAIKTASNFNELFFTTLPHSFQYAPETSLDQADRYISEIQRAVHDIQTEYIRMGKPAPTPPPVIPPTPPVTPPARVEGNGTTPTSTLKPGQAPKGLPTPTLPAPAPTDATPSPTPPTPTVVKDPGVKIVTRSPLVQSALETIQKQLKYLSETEKQELLQLVAQELRS